MKNDFWISWRRKVKVMLCTALLMSGVAAAAPQDASTTVERDIHSAEAGRVNSVNGAPVSITIDSRVYAVSEETYIGDTALKDDNNEMAGKLRKLVGHDVGYSWYQTPGQQPVVITIMPIKAEGR